MPEQAPGPIVRVFSNYGKGSSKLWLWITILLSITHSFQYKVTFQCPEDRAEELEWKTILQAPQKVKNTIKFQVLFQWALFLQEGICLCFRLMHLIQDSTPDTHAIGVTAVLMPHTYQGQESISWLLCKNNKYTDRIKGKSVSKTSLF